MRLNPTRRRTTPAYPNLLDHATDRRTFLGLLGGAVAFTGLAASGLQTACAGEPDAAPEDLVKQVAKLATQLGDPSGKVRKNATAKLIELGTGTGKDTTADARAKKIVLEQIEPIVKHEDPEVAERAKAIILAVNPPPPPTPPDDPAELAGDIAP